MASLAVARPADARALLDAAIGARVTALQPVSKCFRGYGGVVRTSGVVDGPTARTPELSQ
ncbi:hypothetical protein [Streptomyces sp. NPDC053431]|uniref:hypothetical protein n=1 Tax=Streptomyces sp. NPDC053431 TaxID=3365703 RepID=UPI0037D691F6